MAKIEVHATLKSDFETHIVDSKGIVADQKITYQDGDIQVVLSWSEEILHMRRKHQDYELNFLFQIGKKTEGSYELLKEKMQFPMQIQTKKYRITGKKIELLYQLNIDGVWKSYDYQVKYEVEK